MKFLFCYYGSCKLKKFSVIETATNVNIQTTIVNYIVKFDCYYLTVGGKQVTIDKDFAYMH